MTKWISGEKKPKLGTLVLTTFWTGIIIQGWFLYDEKKHPVIVTDYEPCDLPYYDPVTYPWYLVEKWAPTRRVDEL